MSNTWYIRKKPLNKNQEILQTLWVKQKDLARFCKRSRQAVMLDFKNTERMQRFVSKHNERKGVFYARILAEMTGKEIDENIFF